MSTPTPAGIPPVRRIDRVLAYMSLGLTVVAIGCFFAVIIATSAGAEFSEGIWPVVRLFPLIALPIAFVLIIALLIMSFVRRARANRAS